MAERRILIVEDERTVLLVAANAVRTLAPGTRVHEAGTAREALLALARVRPHLVLLDLDLGDRISGLDICKAIRADPRTAKTGVIILTGCTSSETEVALFEAGADDYIRKESFTPQIVVSRMEAVLRRSGAPLDATITYGPILVDGDRREVRIGENVVYLSPREFDIVRSLVGNPDRAVARHELLARNADLTTSCEERTVDVHIVSIRRKLRAHGVHIKTVFGIGYRLWIPPRSERIAA